jgi:hypothetical protein
VRSVGCRAAASGTGSSSVGVLLHDSKSSACFCGLTTCHLRFDDMSVV